MADEQPPDSPGSASPPSSDHEESDGAMLLAASSQQVRDQLDAVAGKHRARGDEAFDKGEWQPAVHAYTRALTYAWAAEAEAQLLSRRSEALCNLCAHLRSIPARHSEYRALYGHDPTHLAQLALKDAAKARQLRPTWHRLYALQGRALLLLERYSDAEGAYLEGLALAPGEQALAAGLARVQALMEEEEQEQQQLLAEVRRTGVAGGGGSGAAGEAGAEAAVGSPPGGGSVAKRQRRLASAAPAERDDFDCTLCLKLMYEPVTTPCGHTFCRDCFARSMDHGHKCPMCRTVLHVGRELPVTISLKNILGRLFASEYAERAAEAAAAAGAAQAAAGGGGAGGGAEAALAPASVTLPLFVMCTVLPGERMALNIFEPRYRLMVRRVMEGNRRLGMAAVGRSGPDGLDELAVEAEITECQMQPDGRYYLELVGRRRLRLQRSWDLDGYRVASAELVADAPPPPQRQQQQQQQEGQQQEGQEGQQQQQQQEEGGRQGAAGGARGLEGQERRRFLEAASVPQLVEEVVTVVDGMVERFRGLMAARRVGAGQVRDLLERVGDRPPKSDPEAVSWWAARMLLLLLPQSSEGLVRRELLCTTNTSARLVVLYERLEARLQGLDAGVSCSIM